MRQRRIRASLLLGPALAAALVPACSLFVDLDPLSSGEGGAGGTGGTGGIGGSGGSGGSGGQGGAGAATSTGPGGGPLSFRDDEFEGEFDQGTFDGTGWGGDGWLTLAQDSGTFTSRVFDAGTSVTWLTLGWAPLGPYGKALPDGGMTESYPQGSAAMADNVLLLHLDGTGNIDPGEKLLDSSGLGYSATAAGEPLVYTNGRFGQAIDDGANEYVYVDTGSSPDLELGTGDFTWSLWVKANEDCSGNKVYLGVDDGAGDTPHLWLGCADSGESGCPAGATGGRASGVFKSNHQTGGTQVLCGSTRINDGQWHHLAVVKSGYPAVTVTLHVDGVVESTKQTTWASPIVYSTGPELAVGAFSEGSYQATGHFDEVAIWRRAFTAGEVADLHLRGALRLSFQVRGCSLPDCGDDPPFVGPGGDPTLAYVAPAGLDPWAEVPLDAVSQGGVKTARYLQYRATFASDAFPAAPAVLAVELQAQSE